MEFKKKNLIIKANKYIVLITLLVAFLIFGWFYWFQYRPTKIRHDCSWVKKHKDAISERPAQGTYDVPEAMLDKLKEKGIIDICPWERGGVGFLKEWIEHGEDCANKNNKIIRDLKMMLPAVPAKDWWIKATNEEYQFCIHDKGL